MERQTLRALMTNSLNQVYFASGPSKTPSSPRRSFAPNTALLVLSSPKSNHISLQLVTLTETSPFSMCVTQNQLDPFKKARTLTTSTQTSFGRSSGSKETPRARLWFQFRAMAALLSGLWRRALSLLSWSSWSAKQTPTRRMSTLALRRTKRVEAWPLSTQVVSRLISLLKAKVATTSSQPKTVLFTSVRRPSQNAIQTTTMATRDLSIASAATLTGTRSSAPFSWPVPTIGLCASGMTKTPARSKYANRLAFLSKNRSTTSAGHHSLPPYLPPSPTMDVSRFGTCTETRSTHVSATLIPTQRLRMAKIALPAQSSNSPNRPLFLWRVLQMVVFAFTGPTVLNMALFLMKTRSTGLLTPSRRMTSPQVTKTRKRLKNKSEH